MKKKGFWQALESLTGGAVLAEWALELGDEFERARHFLHPTQGEAKTYPCTSRIPCECTHRVERVRDDQQVAVCDCGECAPVRLTEADLTVWKLDVTRLAEAAMRAGQWHRTEVELVAPGLWQVGEYEATRSPIYLMFGQTEGQLIKCLEELAAAASEPFIILAPTARLRTKTVNLVLARLCSAFITLDTAMVMETSGKLRGNIALKTALKNFEIKLTERNKPGQRVATDETENKPAEPRFSLRKHLGVWQLVFEGRKALIEDERGVQIVSYLLRNPPAEPVHAVPLETKVWAREWVESNLPAPESEVNDTEMDQEVSGAKLDKGENTLLKKKFRELLEIIEDDTLPQTERDAAQMELDEIHKSLGGTAGRVVDGATKAAERVRKAIKRLHSKLAKAVNESRQPNLVLRDFAGHLLTCLIVPSSRFNRGKGSRNRAGVAGTFTYEPPAGVIWKGE